MRSSVVPNRNHCPVCKSDALTPCFAATAAPVHCNVLCTTREQALTVARGDIQLLACGDCAHVFNAVFDESLADYTGAYENSLHYSPTFRNYAETQAAALIERHNLRGRTVVEIGCGDAYFLRLLCRSTGNRGIGFEPRAGGHVIEPTDNISIVRDYYSEKYSDVAGDLVCCRQVLEHIPDPIAFLQTVRQAVAVNPSAVVFFEVPNAACMFRESRIWDIIYEHFSYFTPQSLTTAFMRAGFKVLTVEETFGGQYLCIEAICGSEEQDKSHEIYAETSVLGFSREISDTLCEWQARLNTYKGRKTVVWGAGSKGATFLNLLPSAHGIDCVIDVNPRKHGMYVAGTGHPIYTPDVLKSMENVSVLLMNPMYEHEVRSRLEQSGISADLQVV